MAPVDTTGAGDAFIGKPGDGAGSRSHAAPGAQARQRRRRHLLRDPGHTDQLPLGRPNRGSLGRTRPPSADLMRRAADSDQDLTRSKPKSCPGETRVEADSAGGGGVAGNAAAVGRGDSLIGRAPGPFLTERLGVDKGAAIQKHRVSLPLRARWTAFSPWGDNGGDKRPLRDVLRPPDHPRLGAAQRWRQSYHRPSNVGCWG